MATPFELYPQLNDINFYKQLSTLQQYDIISIVDTTQLFGLGGAFAGMTRITLNVRIRDDANQPNGGQNNSDETTMNNINNNNNDNKQVTQLRLLAKTLEASNTVLMSCREVWVYKDIVMPLLADRDLMLGMKQNNTLTLQFPVDELSSPSNGQSAPSVSLFGCDEFNAPILYFADANTETYGKCLLLGEIFQGGACHAGTFSGNIPHNKGRDLIALTRGLPQLTHLDIAKKAFAAIPQLHAKYWQNFTQNIPQYMPCYQWYYPQTNDDSTQGKADYEAFVSYGRDAWRQNLSQRKSIKISPYFAAVIDAMINKSTWENLQQQFCQSQRDAENIPLSIIHCDYYQNNTMLSTSMDGRGYVSSVVTNNKDGNNNDNNTNNINNNSYDNNNTKNNNKDKDAHLFILDYEFACIGIPAQDLTQWSISQIPPLMLQQHYKELLQIYYNKLILWYNFYQNQALYVQHQAQQNNTPFNPKYFDLAQIYPFSKLEKDYIAGCQKWAWLVAVSATPSDFVTDEMYQFFIDQLEAFMTFFNITPDNAPIFRR